MVFHFRIILIMPLLNFEVIISTFKRCLERSQQFSGIQTFVIILIPYYLQQHVSSRVLQRSLSRPCMVSKQWACLTIRVFFFLNYNLYILFGPLFYKTCQFFSQLSLNNDKKFFLTMAYFPTISSLKSWDLFYIEAICLTPTFQRHVTDYTVGAAYSIVNFHQHSPQPHSFVEHFFHLIFGTGNLCSLRFSQTVEVSRRQKIFSVALFSRLTVDFLDRISIYLLVHQIARRPPQQSINSAIIFEKN